MDDFKRLDPCVCEAGFCYPTHPDNAHTFCAHGGPVVVREQIEDRDAEIERLRAELTDLHSRFGLLNACFQLAMQDDSYTEIERLRWELAQQQERNDGLRESFVEQLAAERQRARLPDDLVERIKETQLAEVGYATWKDGFIEMEGILVDILAWHESSNE